jgi:DNA-binding response OmpR family regulator
MDAANITNTTNDAKSTVKKILIADDERHIRTLLKQSLRKLTEAGVVLLIAENGAEAMRFIERERPALIFLDLMMPGLHGFDVCLLAKSDPRYNDPYIIILSARSQALDKQMGSISGADEYITKPFDPEYVAARAVEVLKIDLTATAEVPVVSPTVSAPNTVTV